MDSIYEKINVFEQQRLCKLFGPVFKRNTELTYCSVLKGRNRVIWKRYGDIWMMHGYLFPVPEWFEDLFTEPRRGILWLLMLPLSALLLVLAFFPQLIPAAELIREAAGRIAWIPGFISDEPAGFVSLVLGIGLAFIGTAKLIVLASDIDARKEVAQELLKWIEMWDNMIDSIINNMEEDNGYNGSIHYHGNNTGCNGGTDTENEI